MKYLKRIGAFFADRKAHFKRQKWYGRLLWTVIYGIIFFFLFLGAIDINFLWLFGHSPRMSELREADMSLASELYSCDGVMLGKYFNENRSPVKLTQVSPYMVKGLIATEDARFYSHHGIDATATFSAIAATATGDRRGGSTITQQLVKNMLKTRTHYSRGLFGMIPGVRVVIVKLKEWIGALKVELFFSKEEILSLYLNTVDFGSNSFGIKTASRTFFNTTPDSLKVEEAAVLIGLLKAPTRYSPVSHPDNALRRRNTVLNQMVKYDVITQKLCDSVKGLPISLNYSVENNYEGQALYFRGAVARELQDWLKENNYDLWSDGLKIYTTLDSRLQAYAEDATRRHMQRTQRIFNDHWGKEKPWKLPTDTGGVEQFVVQLARQTKSYRGLKKKFTNEDSILQHLQIPHKMKVFTWKGERDTMFSTIDSIRYYLMFLNTGFASIEPQTGYIKTWVGGIDFKYFKYDHVKQAKRQPGSTFKAFVYTAAIDKGIDPCDTFVDRPVTVNYIENGEAKTWSAHNADWLNTGEHLTVKHAFATSLNSITIQVMQKIGWTAVAQYAHMLGIKSPLKEVPSICLGSSDVSLFEMLTAYCPLVNGGYKVDPIMVTKIVDKNGKTVYEGKIKKTKVLSDETAFLMTVMFRGGLSEPGGTTQGLWAYDLFRFNTDFGGKTGTSNNYADGWFMGITPNLIGGVWVGGEHRNIRFRTSALGEGCKTALPEFALYMEHVLADSTFKQYRAKFADKPPVKINRNYTCHTYHPIRDSIRKARKDSLFSEARDSVHPDMPTNIDTLNIQIQ